MPAVRSPKRTPTPTKKPKSRSYKPINADLLILALINDDVQEGESISAEDIIERVKRNGAELNSPRGPRCASYVNRHVRDFSTRGLLEMDDDDSELGYKLTEKGIRKFQKAFQDLERPGERAGDREKVQFAQDLRHRIFPSPEVLIEKLYRKMRKLERLVPCGASFDTDDESDEMDVELNFAASNNRDEEAENILIGNVDHSSSPGASSSRLTLDRHEANPPPEPALPSAHNTQNLLSPPFSDALSDDPSHTPEFTPTPPSRRTPAGHPVDRNTLGDSRVLDRFDDVFEAGEGDVTMVDPEPGFADALTKKLEDLIATNEPEPTYVDQGIGTKSISYVDAEAQVLHHENPPAPRVRAFPYFVKYAMAKRSADQHLAQLEVHKRARADAEALVDDLTVENVVLREHIDERETIIGHIENQRDDDAETHRAALAEKDEQLTEALEGKAVYQAELKERTGLYNTLKRKYDELQFKVSTGENVFAFFKSAADLGHAIFSHPSMGFCEPSFPS